MQLSVIIVSFNTREITRQCLKSIRDSALSLDYEVILVDNASTDGTTDIVRDDFPDVRLVSNRANRLFAKANNQGMQIATGDYYLFLNSDTVVESGHIEKLYDFLHENVDSVGCVSPVLINADRTCQSIGFPLPSCRTSFFSVFGLLARKLPEQLKPVLLPLGHECLPANGAARVVGWVPGTCLMCSSRLAHSLEGFDESFDFYYEDLDFCRRVRGAGLDVCVLLGSSVIHLGGASTPDLAWSNRKMSYGKARYYKKFFSPAGARFNLFMMAMAYGVLSLLDLRVHTRKVKALASKEHFLTLRLLKEV